MTDFDPTNYLVPREEGDRSGSMNGSTISEEEGVDSSQTKSDIICDKLSNNLTLNGVIANSERNDAGSQLASAKAGDIINVQDVHKKVASTSFTNGSSEQSTSKMFSIISFLPNNLGIFNIIILSSSSSNLFKVKRMLFVMDLLTLFITLRQCWTVPSCQTSPPILIRSIFLDQS